MAATDQQMQTFANERVRPFAEKLRELFNLAADHQSAIDEVYDRGVSNSRWTDARTDGPPKLLVSGNSASPDDMLNFNTALDRILKFKNGTFASVEQANEFAALWAVLIDACVRPIGS